MKVPPAPHAVAPAAQRHDLAAGAKLGGLFVSPLPLAVSTPKQCAADSTTRDEIRVPLHIPTPAGEGLAVSTPTAARAVV
ncbi:MAG TPA: hypothetical protein VK524_16155 [Polyangiaceae bacterium]|nr:hypothetical protein [Polyangiaceae bacterium]